MGIVLTIVLAILTIVLIFALRYKCRPSRTWVSQGQGLLPRDAHLSPCGEPRWLPLLCVLSGLRPPADQAGHQPPGDQNLQLSGLLSLPPPASSLGLGQQLQLESHLCDLPGGVPGWPGGSRASTLYLQTFFSYCVLSSPRLCLCHFST